MTIRSSTIKERKGRQSQRTGRENPHQSRQEEERKCEENGDDLDLISVPYLPTGIVSEILSRVRIKTLFNCHLVCKSWASLISTPEFAQLHLSRSPTNCLIKSGHKFHPNELHLINPESPYSLMDKLVFPFNVNVLNFSPELHNSCNGLVCFSTFFSLGWPMDSRNIFVCNPVLREYIILPEPPNVTGFQCNSCALGFSRITNQYKVVWSSFDDCRTKIYTLGGGSWRSIEKAPYYTINHSFCTLPNGALHWIPFHRHHPFICCFDFETEQFGAVPEPLEFGQLERERSFHMQVGVINGNLTICDFNPAVGDRIVIWVMKEYGVRESWSKDFVITNLIYDTNWYSYKLIMINTNGEILMKLNNHSIVLYDPKSEAFMPKLIIFGDHSSFQAIAHVPSLISLQDVAKGEKLKVLG